MPATEATWRDTLQLHRIFAVTGVLMTIGTVWMFWKDHARSWKRYQVDVLNIDLKMTDMRQQQYLTGDALEEQRQRALELATAKAQPLPPEYVSRFKTLAEDLDAVLNRWKGRGYPYSTVSFDARWVERQAAELENKLGPEAAEKRQAAAAAEQEAEAALAAVQQKPDDKALHAELQKKEAAARTAQSAATAAEAAASRTRSELVRYLQRVVDDARIREDKALGIRKFKSGEIDAAKANVDLAIRDQAPPDVLKQREEAVQELVGDPANVEEESKSGKQTFAVLNEIYQSISAVRKDLERTLKQMTAPVDAAQKALEESIAELERLRNLERERQEKLLFTDRYPWIFGKKLLTLPILDAFNSPRKIDNLWSDGLTQNYNFSYVRRFDRCTTCHQSLVKTLPGTATTPAFIHDETFEMVVVPPSGEAAPKPRIDPATGKEIPLALEDWLGIRFAKEGLLNPDDVTVTLVVPKSPGAKAHITERLPSDAQHNGLEIRQAVAQVVSPPGSAENLYPKLPGLLVGDVITGINGDPLFGGNRGPQRVEAMLVALAAEGKPIRLTVRRGLPNPYIAHPRLDLYLTDASPHRMQTFACTICHEGQGSATAFEWASHTPNTVTDMRRWINEHGWFDNPHWIYPMYARRFAESACLKCHHEVTELEPSERFPDAPAPKVTHGYHLIRKYGCYGCHEVNGYDGPDRRIGPDLRLEPNFFAVAQQIDAELREAETSGSRNQEAGSRGRESAESGQELAQAPTAADPVASWKEALGDLTRQVASRPEEGAPRQRLKAIIEERVAAAGKDATALDRTLASLANMLKDVETPGTLRRPGPSLRFLAQKADPAFVYDWIENPQRFRPTTRMPRFFGLWDHLKDSEGRLHDAVGPRLEPIEIRGLLAYIDSYAAAQRFEPEARPSGIHAWTEDEKIARGKIQFQTRGCLACHSHKDFPEVEKYRSPNEIVQGPDLSGVGTKFAKDRNPVGPDWLYSWIKNPTRYHARTLMPNLYLDPERDLGADINSPDDDKWFDPADDIVTYLLASSKIDWQPIPAALTAMQPLDAAGQQALKDLTLEYLNEVFYKDQAVDYYVGGIPQHLEGELKGAEKDLIVREGESLTDAQRLKYIGRKTIAKYGCFGCHDIPGFEDAKPIGTGLADWGRKDPARLAFEHITHYIERGHGHAPHAARGGQRSETSAEAMYAESTAKSKAADPSAAQPESPPQPLADSAAHSQAPASEESDQRRDFFVHALEAGNRIGFIYQKLKEPRSFDFDKTENKRFNERLRMPQFPFSAEEREAVITFVLGLVADPPQPKYIFQPPARDAALIAGRQVLEKYNCGACHVLGLEKWQISYAPGELGERAEPAVYPFLKPHFSPQQLAAAAKPDKRNELHSTLAGLPPAEKNDGYPLVFDQDNALLDSSSDYAQRELRLALDLYQHTIVDGSPYLTGQLPVIVPIGSIDARYPTWGGTLTKYLLPEVTKLERQVNPNASGSEAYGWLPPPLIGEGSKVQTPWLRDFLLDPYAIRPAVFLRMPKFNMSVAEATALANYFAAVDNAEYPYAYSSTRDRARLAALEAEYVKRSEGSPPGGQDAAGSAAGSGASGSQPGQAASTAPPGMRRLDDAMKIVVDGNFCVKCHLVADFSPQGSERAKAPQLADVYRRLRPEYVRDWIANPKMILPYTSMPVNIPFQDPPPVLSKLYHGTNVEQIQALTDLLMNYDEYARRSTRIADRVQPAPAEGAAPATGAAGGGGSK